MKYTLRKALYILFACAVFFGAGYYMGCRSKSGEAEIVPETAAVKLPTEVEKRVVTVNEVKGKLEEIGELSSYSERYHVVKQADFSRFLLDDIKLPGTTNTLRIECDGIVKVGYSLSDISMEVDNDKEIIYLALPEAKVNDNYVIWDTVECSEKNSFFNPIDFSEYQGLIHEIEATGLAEAEAADVYAKAEQSLKEIIKNYLGVFEYEIRYMS